MASGPNDADFFDSNPRRMEVSTSLKRPFDLFYSRHPQSAPFGCPAATFRIPARGRRTVAEWRTHLIYTFRTCENNSGQRFCVG